jgi:adenylosuccinate synthase
MHRAVVGLGYGDEGKGSVVDYLTETHAVGTVVRFNGGAQAGHNVVRPDGRHHTFGAGTFAGARTHLSRFSLVDPFALASESEHLRQLGVTDPLSLITVDRRALLVTPYHQALNRAQEEARGAARHGSCGMGIGTTVAYSLARAYPPLVGDVLARTALHVKLLNLREYVLDLFPHLDLPPVADLLDTYEAFADRVELVHYGFTSHLLNREDVIFEGAQGVLLDEWRGFHPYTTWSTTTFDNVGTLLAEAGQANQVHRIGVLRTYTTRHGAGPFVSEDVQLAARLPDPHNPTGRWQGDFRVGHFDLVAHRYAVEVAGGVDSIALTHLDTAEQEEDWHVVTGYISPAGERVDRIEPTKSLHDLTRQQELTDRMLACEPLVNTGPDDWVRYVEDTFRVPVSVAGYGPTWQDKHVPAYG